MGPRLHALVLLAWAFVRMLLKKVFGGEPRGLALFQANFEAERLTSLSEAERGEITTFSRCIACGRCNAGDGERIVASRGAYPGTMALMLASSRSMPDFAASVDALRFISEDDLANKEKLCPTRVPMRKIAGFMRRHA
jgi:succinate dehydrogenase/fumarate reductase-like Fe-S protein